MADTAVHSFTQKSTPVATDEMYLVQSPFGAGDDRRATLANLGTYLSTSTLAAGTITTSQPMTLTQTWNAGAVAFTGILANFTNTASSGSSMLIDLQLSTTSIVKIREDGFIFANGGTTGGMILGANGSTAAGVGLNYNNTGRVSCSTGFEIGANQDSPDCFLRRGGAAASWQYGDTDVDLNANIVAQTTRTQGALTGGTSNQAGKDWTFIASPGKGTGAGGSIIFQTAPAGASSSTVNAPVTALTIDSTKLCTFANTVIRINQTPSAVGTGTKTISNAADSSTNFGHYVSFNFNGTTYFIPCGVTAPT